mgnify:FL=1|tara:strand:+ start:434 stop:646 length:213 start_codon:yes stop_codon:yes gene_type:complete
MQSIDLHGVKHGDVQDIVMDACFKLRVPFIVITGKSARMKRIVRFAVKKFGLETREEWGNPGRVIVYEDR